MNAKLTLRLDQKLIEDAKEEAGKRGKSVSQMVAGFFEALSRQPENAPEKLPPITRSLQGVLKGSELSEADYKRHLEEKFR